MGKKENIMAILIAIGLAVFGLILYNFICLITRLTNNAEQAFFLCIIFAIFIIMIELFFAILFQEDISLYICKNNQIYIKHTYAEHYRETSDNYCRCINSDKKNIVIGNYVYKNFGHKDEISKLNIYIKDERTKESYFEKITEDIIIDHTPRKLLE